MKKTLLLPLLILIWAIQVSAENISLDVSHCSGEESFICIKKAYTKKILIHTAKMKRDYNVSKNLISKIDAKLERVLKSKAKLEIFDKRVLTELALLWDSKKDKRIKELLYYVAYKSQFHIAIADSVENSIESGENNAVVNQDEIAKVMKMEYREFSDYMNNTDASTLESIAKFIYNDSLYNKVLFSDYVKYSSLSRDTRRKSYQMRLSASLQVYFSDNSYYPSNEELGSEWFLALVTWWKIDTDPLAWYTINGCTFWYRYEVWERNWITEASYRISNCVENSIKANWANLNIAWSNNRIFELSWEWENYSAPYYINQPADLWEYIYPKSFEELSSEELKDFYTFTIEKTYREKYNYTEAEMTKIFNDDKRLQEFLNNFSDSQ